MPQQNRVDVWGKLQDVPDRGTRMGNRGILHDETGAIVRNWAHSTWVSCLLDFRERKGTGKFSPGHYSKLFFLDEATAFAAGHRPCGECQRARYREFKAAWELANDAVGITVKEMDRRLHAERTAMQSERPQQMIVNATTLPFGAMFEYRGSGYLKGEGELSHSWSYSGYGEGRGMPEEVEAVLLTPASIVRAFAGGFKPDVHSSLAGNIERDS